MTDTDLFESHFKESVKFAEEKFLEHGELNQSVLLGWNRKGGITALVVFADFDEKMRGRLREVYTKTIASVHEEGNFSDPPDHFVQMAEVWQVERHNDEVELPAGREMPEHTGVRPSEDPNRTENIIVYGETRNGKARVWSKEIFREPDLHLGKEKAQSNEQGDVRSLTAEFLWGDPLENDIDTVTNMMNEVIGTEPSDQECINLAIGLIRAFSNDQTPFGQGLPPNMKQAMKKAANLIEEKGWENGT